MSDRDEFDEYDFSEFTNQDLQEIDAHLARKHSPFNTFLSSKKYFTVTDLVSPTWYARLVSTPPSISSFSRCEVQYEYSLYGKRNKPFHLRPSIFTSKTGKHIRVHQQIAHANDRRLKRGKACLFHPNYTLPLILSSSLSTRLSKKNCVPRNSSSTLSPTRNASVFGQSLAPVYSPCSSPLALYSSSTVSLN